METKIELSIPRRLSPRDFVQHLNESMSEMGNAELPSVNPMAAGTRSLEFSTVFLSLAGSIAANATYDLIKAAVLKQLGTESSKVVTIRSENVSKIIVEINVDQ